MRKLAVTVLVGVLGMSASAWAQPDGGGGLGPGYVFMDKIEAHSMFSADVGITTWNGDATGYRLDLHGQLITLGGIGGYATIPVLFGSVDTGNGSESDSAVGNLELGALYALQLPLQTVVLRGGIALPTNRSDDFNTDYAVLLNLFSDLTNLALVAPKTTTLRLSASVGGQTGLFYYRGDLGADLFLDSPGNNPDPILRINVAGGLDLGSAAAGIELVTLANTDDTTGNESFVHTLALTGRYTQGPVRPGLAIGFPLDDTFSSLIDLYIFAGIDVDIESVGR